MTLDNLALPCSLLALALATFYLHLHRRYGYRPALTLALIWAALAMSFALPWYNHPPSTAAQQPAQPAGHIPPPHLPHKSNAR